MDIEKIIYLVALALYGILSTVLSIVRTLKTSKISSEVKSVLPPIDGVKQPIDDGQPVDVEQSIDVEQPIDDVIKTLSLDELLALFNKIRENKK